MGNELEYSADKFGRCSVKIRVSSVNPANEEDFRKILHHIIYELGKDCLENEGTVIGHIKAYLKTSSGFLKASLVSLKSSVVIEGKITAPVQEAELALAAIIFGLKDEDVRSYIQNCIKVAQYRFTIVMIPEFPHTHSH
ncbi:MAG: hypothetical protein ACFFCD_04775 [Promethearchaeota archaeon]